MNRWVGIVSLRDAPVVTQVHRIALAIEAANRRRSYVFDGRDVPYSRMRSEIRSVARRYAFLQDWERWNVATDAVRWFHEGAVSPRGLPTWLSEDLRPRLRPRKHAPITSTPRPSALLALLCVGVLLPPSAGRSVTHLDLRRVPVPHGCCAASTSSGALA